MKHLSFTRPCLTSQELQQSWAPQKEIDWSISTNLSILQLPWFFVLGFKQGKQQLFRVVLSIHEVMFQFLLRGVIIYVEYQHLVEDAWNKKRHSYIHSLHVDSQF